MEKQVLRVFVDGKDVFKSREDKFLRSFVDSVCNKRCSTSYN